VPKAKPVFLDFDIAQLCQELIRYGVMIAKIVEGHEASFGTAKIKLMIWIYRMLVRLPVVLY
jgi:hypothetical protein